MTGGWLLTQDWLVNDPEPESVPALQVRVWELAEQGLAWVPMVVE